VYGIVKQNHGYIWVESEPGRGSNFEVFLPRSPFEASRPRPRAGGPLDLHGTETILIVEDEPSVRSVARRILAKRGYTVLEADGGAQALELATRHEGGIDLLLTDVIMPGMSGRELANRFARLQPNASVIYMSGYMEDALVQRSIVAQELPLLQKPFTPVSLTAKVRQVLDPERR
jgi:CheY-like chemotaxis protein